MVFTKKDLLEQALILVPNTSPKQHNFKSAIEFAYFSEFDVQRQNISPESYLKFTNDFLDPFCKSCRKFYLGKQNKCNGSISRMIQYHQRAFDMAVPHIDNFIVLPPPPEPMDIQVAAEPLQPPQPLQPNPAGDNVKAPLKKTQMYKVNMVAKCA